MKKQALQIIKRLREHGYQALYAGGYVRDMLLKRESSDIDIATDAKPDVVESLFEKTLAVGKAFGVIVVVIDGHEIEVATFRADGDYSDGRRPNSISFCSMEEDAKRRDLTINGMFYDPIEDKIYDSVQGMEDLQAGIIRLIGNPEERIAEDKLRMLRVIRFAARFDFKIDFRTMQAVRDHAEEITQVSIERIADEIIKILRAGNFRKSLNWLKLCGLLDKILPEISALRGVDQPPQYHPEGDVFEHTVIALENLPKDASDEVRMGVLFHDSGKPSTMTIEDRIRFNGHDLKGKYITEEALKRLKFSNAFIERVSALVENHMKFMHAPNMRTSRLKRFLALPYFEEHLTVHYADCMASHKGLENYEFILSKLNTFKPEEIRPPKILSGKELLSMGFKPGPLFKTILTEVEDRQLEGSITNTEEALSYVRETYSV